MVRTYEACDRWVGRLMDALLDGDTVFCLVSDHGGTPTTYQVTNVADVLEQALAGLQGEHGPRPRRRPATGDRLDEDQGGYPGVVNIFLNVKGREPTGIVEPGEGTSRCVGT